jgi:serine/threonine protein phosphatase 1
VIAPRGGLRLARLHGARRIWAVAAIHGAAPELIRIHDQISDRFRQGDRVVYLGGYMGHGALVRQTVDELLDFRRRVLARRGGLACDVVFLRGAQEEMLQKLLQLQFAPNPGEVLAWMIRAGIEPTVRDYGIDVRQGAVAARSGPQTITRWTGALRSAINAAPGHVMLLASLYHAAVAADGGALFVHAGVNPSRPLAAQADAFWWGGGEILDLAQPFAGFRRVIKGFDKQQRGFVETEFAVSIDGGAGRGGRLLAACFAPEGSVLDRIET